MRILIVMNMYPPFSDGGYPLLCEETVEELKQRNHEVLVLTSTFYAYSSRQNLNYCVPCEQYKVVRLRVDRGCPIFCVSDG